MISDDTDELFDSLKNRYQNNLESMRDSEFVFYYVQLLDYKCHSRSYIDFPDWIKNKKATINPSNKKDNNVFNML